MARSHLTSTSPEIGPRYQLTYKQWVDLLAQEAKAVAENNPENLVILLGDSISLWFPTHLLPINRTWLNQGISGETTARLLERLDLFDETQPQTIFLMIGINDLIRGADDDTILANQAEIIHYLKNVHPQTQIVVQSVLPHAAEAATWEGRDRLLEIPNSRIRHLNQELKEIATTEDADYLELYPLFADGKGNLQPTLSTDGLHLNEQGYLVWRTALEMYSQLELQRKQWEQ
jgi:lysophospholipase L1-like esterase